MFLPVLHRVLRVIDRSHGQNDDGGGVCLLCVMSDVMVHDMNHSRMGHTKEMLVQHLYRSEKLKLTSCSNKCLPSERREPTNDVRKELALRTWCKLRDPICVGNVSV